MILQTKAMIAGCVIAVVIGALAVFPLNDTFFPINGRVIPNPQSDSAQIGLSLSSAHIWQGIADGSDPHVSAGMTFIATQMSLKATKYLNSNESIPDAEIDYFLIEVHNDQGYYANFSEHMGTAYNRSFSNSALSNLTNTYWHPFGSNPGPGGGDLYPVWAVGTSKPVGFQDTYSSSNLPRAAILANSTTLTISISLLGTLTVVGDNVTISRADTNLIQQVQLQKTSDGFRY